MFGFVIFLLILLPVAFVAGQKRGYLRGWRDAYLQAMDDGWGEPKEISA